MLNYTYGTNGIKVPEGKEYYVNIWPCKGSNPDSDHDYQEYKNNVLKDIKNGNYAQDLYTISKQNYGTSIYAGYLAYVNGVALHGDFRVGDLKIPKMEEIKNVDASEYQTDGYYVVKKGDTFKKIAELVYDDPNFADYLKEVNGLTNLQEGMKIFIPVVGYSYSK